MKSFKRAEEGPEVVQNYSSSNKFTDYSFHEKDQLVWEGYETGDGSTWTAYYDADWYEFKRLPELFGSYPLFDSQGPHFNDIEQGGAGTCYALASMSAIAEFPELVYDVF
jgi:hypothetical protein